MQAIFSPLVRRWLLAVWAAIVLLLLAPAASAVTWIREEIAPAPGYESVCSAIDASGGMHMSFWDGFCVGYAYWDGLAWSTELIEALSYPPEGTSLAFDALGRPHVVWPGEDPSLVEQPTALRHAVRDGGTWTVESVDTSGTSVGRRATIAIRGSAVAIAYQASGTELRCARWSGDAWQIETVDAVGLVDMLGQRVTAAIDANGIVHLAYRAFIPDSLGLRYARRSRLGWDLRFLAPEHFGYWPTLSVDATGHPSIVHAGIPTGAISLFLTELVDGQPFTTTIDDSGQAGYWPVHKRDAWGNLHVAYHEATTPSEVHTRYARRCGTEWQIEPADSEAVLGPVCMSLDPQGGAHLVYPLATGALVQSRAAPLVGGATHVVVSPATHGTHFEVVAVDEGGAPIPGAEIVVDFSACPGVRLCLPETGQDYGHARGRYVVRAFADCFGWRSLSIRGGGISAASCAEVRINGQSMGHFPVASPDRDGDLDVGNDDLANFNGCYGGTNPTCDFDGDGHAGLSDLAILSAILNVSCPSAVSAGDTPPRADLFLAPAAPTPAAGPVSLSFELPVRAEVRLEVLDLLGRRVRVLATGQALEPGRHVRAWDGKTESGTPAAPGVYRGRLVADGKVRTTAIVLVR